MSRAWSFLSTSSLGYYRKDVSDNNPLSQKLGLVPGSKTTASGITLEEVNRLISEKIAFSENKQLKLEKEVFDLKNKVGELEEIMRTAVCIRCCSGMNLEEEIGKSRGENEIVFRRRKPSETSTITEPIKHSKSINLPTTKEAEEDSFAEQDKRRGMFLSPRITSLALIRENSREDSTWAGTGFENSEVLLRVHDWLDHKSVFKPSKGEYFYDDRETTREAISDYDLKNVLELLSNGHKQFNVKFAVDERREAIAFGWIIILETGNDDDEDEKFLSLSYQGKPVPFKARIEKINRKSGEVLEKAEKISIKKDNDSRVILDVQNWDKNLFWRFNISLIAPISKGRTL